MSGVENFDRGGEPEGLAASLRARIALNLKPYQRRSVAFMLGEERAEGGTARAYWVRVPLPAPEGARRQRGSRSWLPGREGGCCIHPWCGGPWGFWRVPVCEEAADVLTWSPLPPARCACLRAEGESQLYCAMSPVLGEIRVTASEIELEVGGGCTL